MIAETLDAREVAIAEELRRLSIVDEARKRHRSTNRAHIDIPSPRTLAAFLAEPDSDPEWVIDELLQTGANVVLAAPYKAGKSTARDNLIAALADGRPFLGAFSARPRRVALIDAELDERTLRRWLRVHGIASADTVTVVPLRGRVSSFNILEPATRAAWADVLLGADVLILDCLRPVLDALGLDENRDAGQFLSALDELKRAAGISEAVIVHHMGHSGERSRGDSRILDWPDATWKLVRGSTDDAASARYFSAFGRDVDVPETRLHFDDATRALALGQGNRQDGRAEELVDPLISFLAAQEEPASVRTIEAAMASQGHRRAPVRSALNRLVEAGQVLRTRGERGALLHALNAGSVPACRTVPPVRRHSESECASVPIGHAAHSLPALDHGKSRSARSSVDPGYCSHGVTIGARCSRCGGFAEAVSS